MKRIYYLFSYILPVMVLLSACLKDETKITFKLPRETQSGENTLGFRVGNDVWVNYGKRCFIDMGCSGPNLTGYFWHHPEQIEIRAY